jgi:mannose PTS system EIIA component
MIGVVVVTHGQLATELLNAAETIVGDLPQFAAVSIGWHEDTPTRARRSPRRSRGPQGAGVLILTDMFGGTPSNLAMTFLGRQGGGDHRRQPADADQAGRPAPQSPTC